MATALQWTFRGFAIAAALLASLQPVLGAFAFFRGGDVDYARLHLVAGGLLYNVTIVLALLAGFTKFRRRWPLLGISVVQYAFAHVQLRLGLGSNADVGLLAYHVPLGVLILVVAYLTLALSFGVEIAPERA